MKSRNVVPAERANDRFKELGSSVYMVSAPIGLAMNEVVYRARRLARLWKKHRTQPTYLNKISDLFREIASVEAALDDLKRVEKQP